MNDYFTSLIRTWVPLAIGAALSWLGLHHINPALTAQQLANLITVLTAFVVGLYYAIVRLLEKYVSPKFGWLLGLAKAPSYPVSTPAAAAASTETQARAASSTATTPPSGE